MAEGMRLGGGIVPVLTERTVAVLRVLVGDGGRGVGWVVHELAERSGVNPMTVRVVLVRLIDAGWVRSVGDGDGRCYRLTARGVPAAERVLRSGEPT